MGTADWRCKRCGFEPNFARRRFCFDCGEARAGGAAVGAAIRPQARSGPVGDGGRRPMLAWARGRSEAGRQEEEGPPSKRTPGASIAAIVEQARRGAARVDAVGADAAGGANPPSASRPARAEAAMDSEGFITVGRGGRPTVSTAARAAAAGEGPRGGSGPADVPPAPTGRADERDGVGTPADQQGDDHDLGDDEPAQRDPAELRRRWADEAALVKRLAKQGLPEGHPALAAAHAARDAAEAAWRQAKPPAPATTRLRWAQTKLTKALEMADATNAAIKKAEEDHEKLMVQLHDRRADDGERVRMRQAAVEALRREIGGTDSPARARGGDTTALLEACGGLCSAVGPGLAALAEKLPEGSDEWQAVNDVLATLATSQRRVEEAAGMHQPQAFDIGDDDADVDDDGDLDEMSVGTPWSESHELDQGQGDTQRGQANGGTGSSAPHSGEDWGRWGQAQQWQATQWRTDERGRWHRSSWADQWEAEHGQATGWGTRRGGGEHDEESGEPSAKQRKQASGRAAPADGTAATSGNDEVATRPQATAAAAAAASQSSQVPAGSTTFEAQVAEVVQRAIGLGVQPITEDGSDLITLSPSLLERWVADNLGEGNGRR